MIRAILFDADKTLYQIQSEPAYQALYAFLEKKLNLSAEKIRIAHRAQVEKVQSSKDPAKRDYAFALTWALEHLDAAHAESLAQDALDLFWKAIAANLTWEPDILETMGVLKKKHRLAIASDEFPENLEHKLNRVFGKWQDFFEFLITPRETGEMKPSTLYYQLALKKLELRPSEVLVVGDSFERDIEPARAWGLQTLLIAEESAHALVKCVRTLRKVPTYLENLGA
ncbi:HAD family hydrolase [Candidatus Acetothermia bacterium]|nr:HAD family hydrolase [Candidatus Acetothermia bacterium]